MALTGLGMRMSNHVGGPLSLLCAVLAVALLLFLSAPTSGPSAHALEPSTGGLSASVDLSSEEGGYLAVLYNNTNGLPTSEANDIAQTAEGFIWIGSYSGLVRYDGRSFETVGSAEGIASVRCLHVDSQGRLWVGTNDGGLYLMERDSFRRWGESDGLPSTSVRAICEDAQGTLYIATAGGLARMDGELELGPVGDSRLDAEYIYELEAGSDGLIYGVTNFGDLFIIRNGAVDFYLDRLDIPGDGVACIYPDPARPGYIYLETVDSNVFYGTFENGSIAVEPIDVSPLAQLQCLELIDGKLYICARNGIGILTEDGLQLLEGLPMNNSVGHVICDYAGNLWFTSTRQGVMKVVPSRFADLFDRYQLEGEVVNSTCLLDGRLYIATDTGLKVVDGEGVIASIPLTSARTASGEDVDATDLMELLGGCRIRSVIRDSQDRLWFSTWRSQGLVRYDHGEVMVFSQRDGLPSDNVRTVCERQDGTFLVAVTGGISVIEQDHVAATYDESSGIANVEILTVAEGFDGDILCGTDGGGIYVIGEEGVGHLGAGEGLRSESVMRIKRDVARGVLWVVTGNSLAYLDDDYQVHTVERFPYHNNLDLYENSHGEMWVLSSDGIYIVRVDDMLENGEIDSIHYGISDGLPCIVTANSYSELTEDGDLYIAGSTGVAKVNIDESFAAIGDLKAAIPYVEADGVRVYPDEDGTFTISPETRKLTIYGFVYNYSLINPQVAYRLEGFDQSDVVVSRSELDPVDYTNLRGGTYRFVMELKDAVHNESKTVAVQIDKELALYENPWFYVCLALVGGVAIWLAVQRYIQRKMRLLQEKNREEAERARIESELNMARQIQAGALPHDFSTIADICDIDICASMDPAKEVGGDFYDFFMIDDSHLCLVIADVSGKGIPAALFMMDSKSIIKNNSLLGLAPAEILAKANETLCANNEMDMFVTVWLGILDLSTGLMRAANAGHEYPMLKRADSGFELFKDEHYLPIGAIDSVPYGEYELQLHPGDVLFVYTDGAAEANNAQKELFGLKRIADALNQDPDASAEGLLKNVRRAVDDFVAEEEQFDDLTMLCVRYGRTEITRG